MQRPWAGAKSGSPFAAHSPPITGILCLWERSNEKVYTPTDLFFEEPCALEIAWVCTRANVERKDEERNGECRKRERERGTTFPVCNYVGILTAEESLPDRLAMHWMQQLWNDSCLKVDALFHRDGSLCASADHFLATPRSADLDPSF